MASDDLRDVRRILAERSRMAREGAGLSRAQVAERAFVRANGMNLRRITEIENGLGPEPMLDEVVVLAAEYRVSIDWLAGRSGATREVQR